MGKRRNFKIVKKVFTDFLEEHGHRKTLERFAILEEIYKSDAHFNVDELYIQMKNRNHQVSRATIYNTIELMMECNLVRRHQFGDNNARYEQSYFDRQHDHIILTDTGEVLEFCDPRIQSIQHAIEKTFNVNINDHSLYFYGKRNDSLKDEDVED